MTVVTAHGAEYVLSRGGGDDRPRLEGGDENSPSVDAILAMIPIRFAGHGELELLATDGLARLDLLARFAREDVDRVAGELAKVRRELNDSGPALWRLEREIQELAKTAKTLPAEHARLEALKKAAGADPSALEEANRTKALRERERLLFGAAETEVGSLRGEAGVFAAKALRRLGQLTDAQAEVGPNAELVADVTRELARIRAEIESFASRISASCDGARAVFSKNERVLAARHAPEDDAYRALLAAHESDAGRAFERLNLEKTVAQLEKTRDEHAALVRERERVIAAREQLRARQRSLVAEMLKVLDAGAGRMSAKTGGRVKVTVSPESERTKLRALLADILKGKRFEKDQLDLIVANFLPDDLFSLVMSGNVEHIAEKLDSATTAGRLVDRLRATERVYELETVDMPHVPVVTFMHGTTPKASETLSSGQRKEAFFALMLVDRSRVLVIDQPEDDVANKYLAGPLCAMFAEVQDEMQFLFVTHDGNIPILGKARQVIHFASDGRRAWVESQGEPEGLREPMEDNFEGGRSAFVARKEFYGVE